MDKLARKPSSDPIQEKLRQNKSLWNKDVSSFLNNMIHFKKMMNGQPSKFFKEKSKIVNPIPADPASILNGLAHDFNELVQRGNAIVLEQINYSKNRKIKQPQKENILSTTPISTDLSKQLSAFENKYNLVAIGSNPISRFFAKLLNPTIGVSEAARIRKFRMSLLTSCARFFKDLEKLQAEVVKQSNDSINTSYQHLHQCWNDWILIARGFNIYKLNMPGEIVDSGGEISFNNKQLKEEFDQEERTPLGDEIAPPDLKINAPQPKNENDTASEIKNLQQDYKFLLSSPEFLNLNLDVNLINTLFEKLTMPGENKEETFSLLKEEYKNILSQVNSAMGTNKSSFKEIFANNISLEMEKTAQLFLKKWLGKGLHHLSLFDKTSSFRLDVFKMCEDIRKIVNQIMDSLEKDMNIEELSPLVNDVNKKMTALRGLMRALHNSQKPRI